MDELNVKVGDKVLFTSAFQNKRTEKITTVIKVTPTGRIRVGIAPEIQFNRNGSEIGKQHGIYTCRYISALTPEKEKEIKEKETIRSAIDLFHKHEDQLTCKQARKIIGIFLSHGEDQPQADQQ